MLQYNKKKTCVFGAVSFVISMIVLCTSGHYVILRSYYYPYLCIELVYLQNLTGKWWFRMCRKCQNAQCRMVHFPWKRKIHKSCFLCPGATSWLHFFSLVRYKRIKMDVVKGKGSMPSLLSGCFDELIITIIENKHIVL